MHASYNLKYGKIKNEREVLMTKTEVIQRLQKDLGIPRFQAYIEDKDYSEEEYDQLKKDFEAYFTNYVSMFQQILKADWIINNLYLKIIYYHITPPSHLY